MTDNNAIQRMLTRHGQKALRGEDHDLSPVEVRTLGAKMLGAYVVGGLMAGGAIGGTGLYIATASENEPGHTQTEPGTTANDHIVKSPGQHYRIHMPGADQPAPQPTNRS